MSGGCVFVSGGAYSYPEWRIRVLEAHITIRGVRVSVRVALSSEVYAPSVAHRIRVV